MVAVQSPRTLIRNLEDLTDEIYRFYHEESEMAKFFQKLRSMSDSNFNAIIHKQNCVKLMQSDRITLSLVEVVIMRMNTNRSSGLKGTSHLLPNI